MTSPVLLRPVEPASMDDPTTLVCSKGTARSTNAPLVLETIPRTVDTIAPGFSGSGLDLYPRSDEVGLRRPTTTHPCCPTGPVAGSSAESALYDITVPSIAIVGQGVGLESSRGVLIHRACILRTILISRRHQDSLVIPASRSSPQKLPRHGGTAFGAGWGMRLASAPQDEPAGTEQATCDRMAAGQSMGAPSSCHRSPDANVLPNQRQ